VGLLHGRDQPSLRIGARVISSWIITAAALVLALKWKQPVGS